MQDSIFVLQIKEGCLALLVNKDKQVRFRLEQNDFEQLQKRADNAGMTVSKYLRYQVIKEGGDMTVTPQAEQQLKDYFVSVNRLGNNVNQLMREINSDIRTVEQNKDELNTLLLQIRPDIINIKSLLTSLIRQTRI